MIGQTVCLYIDTDEGDLYDDAPALMRTLHRSQVPVQVTDVAKLTFPRVMREVLRARYARLPVIMSVEDEREVHGVYSSVCDERGLTE